jgi:DUF1365 family protein
VSGEYDILITVTAEGVALQVTDHDDQTILVEANDSQRAAATADRGLGKPRCALALIPIQRVFDGRGMGGRDRTPHPPCQLA